MCLLVMSVVYGGSSTLCSLSASLFPSALGGGSRLVVWVCTVVGLGF